MNSELRKRIFTSVVLISLLMAMFLYSYIMVITLITIAIIIWVEFYALISKIFKKHSIKDKFFRFFYKSISLLYLSLLWILSARCSPKGECWFGKILLFYSSCRAVFSCPIWYYISICFTYYGIKLLILNRFKI